MALYVQTQPKLVGAGAMGNALQGLSTCVSGDGMTAAVGGAGDSGNVGAIWFYVRPNADEYTWAPLGSKVVPFDNTGSAEFGGSCSLNFDGSVVVVGGSADNNYIGATWVALRNSSSGYFEQQEPKLVGSGFITSGGCGSGQCIFQGTIVSLAAVSSIVFVTGAIFDNQRGSATVFRKSDTNTSWYQVGSKLVGSGVGLNGWFGYSVSINAFGQVIAVGAYNDAAGSGSVWIFTLNTASSLYVQQGGRLTPFPLSLGFGTAVSLSYDAGTLLVGAYADGSYTGAMFAYTRNATGFFQQQGGKIMGSGSVCLTNCVNQGISLFLSANGNVAVVGGRYDNNQTGAAWIFTRNNNNIWTQYGTKAAGSDYLGNSFQGSENTLSLSADASVFFMGGYGDNTNIGAAWAFNDTFFASTSCPRPADDQYVIFSLSDCLPTIYDTISCTPMCAPGLFPSVVGKVTCDKGVLLNALSFCGGYEQTQSKLVGSGAAGSNSNQGSTCVSGDGMTAGVGGYNDGGGVGAIWFYVRPNANDYHWVPFGPKMVPSDNTGPAGFGTSCSLNFDGSVAIVGGHEDDGYTGATWVLVRNAGGYFEQREPKLVGTGFVSNSVCGFPKCVWQGWSVSIAALSNVFVTGGLFDGAHGSAWVFRKKNTNSSWSQVGDRLVGSGITANAWHGYSVAINAYGSVIAVGAFNDDGGAGSVWIYTLSTITSFYYQESGIPSPLSAAFGTGLSISYDGGTLIVGAYRDNYRGAMFAFTRDAAGLIQQQGKLLGTGYVCDTLQCPFQGISVSLSADGNVAAVGGRSDDNEVGAVWIFTRNGNTWTQFGTKLVGSGGVIPSLQGAQKTLYLSADASVLFMGGIFDESEAGAAWAFNNSFIALSSCPRPADTTTVIYSLSCTSPIISGTTCIPTCAPNYAALPEWIGVFCDNGVVASPSAACIPIPILGSICPSEITANITQLIVVQGSGFLSTYTTSCIFISGGVFLSFPASFLSSSTIACTMLWPDTTPDQTIQLNVAHDDAFGAQISLAVKVLGACEMDKIGSVPGDGVCVCPRGTYDAGTSCIPCGNGEYQNERGKSSCKPCGYNRDTNGETGSTSSASCVCQVNYFPNPDYDPTDADSSPCLICVLGMSCLGNDNVLIRPGYWRANNITTSVLECPNIKSCTGTVANSSTVCFEGYEGPLCTVCKLRYAKIGNECQPCPSGGVNYFVLIILVVFALFICYFLVRTASGVNKKINPAEATHSSSSSSNKGLADVGIGTVFKVFLNYMQVLYYIGRLSANWSPGAASFFSVIGQSTLSPNFVAVQCASTWSFYTRLQTIYISPIIVVVFLSCTYSIRHLLLRKSLTDTLNDLQLAVMVILYQIHPTIMIEVISSLPCQSVPGTGTTYLKADMSVNCENSTYKLYYGVSLLYLLFYVFGMMILFVYRGLYHNAKIGKLFDNTSSIHQKYAFFFIGYTRDCYYWEAVVMMRKLVIAGLSASVSSGLQLVWGAVVIMVSFIVSNMQQPFASTFIIRLELTSLAALYVAVLIGFHSLLIGSGHWSLALLVMFNGTMAAVLFSCCLVKMRTKLVELSQRLPDRFRLKDDVLLGISSALHRSSRHSTNRGKVDDEIVMYQMDSK